MLNLNLVEELALLYQQKLNRIIIEIRNKLMNIKILLADDHKIVRDGLRSLIERQRKMEVIGEAENGRTIVKLAKELSPDIIIMDISMPDLNGIEATRKIVTDNPDIKVIALSMYSDN